MYPYEIEVQITTGAVDVELGHFYGETLAEAVADATHWLRAQEG